LFSIVFSFSKIFCCIGEYTISNNSNAILAESMNHSEDFVLDHSVISSVYCSAERSITRLSVDILRVAVERIGKVRVTAVIRVAFIMNTNIVAISETRPEICSVISGMDMLIVGDSHLLLQVQR
jgi:hypothetical protein